MKILMIDDAKNPREFFKDSNKTRFTTEEVTLVKTYSEGMDHLLDQGPWDVLLLDWNLGEDDRMKNGLTILSRYEHYLNTGRCQHKVKKIILITADENTREEMKMICQEMIKSGQLNEFEAQYHAKIVKY